MNTNRVLSENLRLLMQRRGWSQSSLAERSGISQRTISNVLRGEVSITLDTLDKIASAFGLAGHWLCIPIEDWSRAA